MTIRRIRPIFAIACGIALASCGYVEKDDWMPVQTRSAINNSAALLQAYLTGTTVKSYSDPNTGGHGTQLEYHSPDGKSYLWYPGNKTIVTARWRVQADTDNKPELCYLYGPTSYNPVLKTRGGTWECQSLTFPNIGVGEGVQGDPFNLSSRKVPFIIPDRSFHSTKELYSKYGGSPAQLDFITNLDELNR